MFRRVFEQWRGGKNSVKTKEDNYPSKIVSPEIAIQFPARARLYSILEREKPDLLPVFSKILDDPFVDASRGLYVAIEGKDHHDQDFKLVISSSGEGPDSFLLFSKKNLAFLLPQLGLFIRTLKGLEGDSREDYQFLQGVVRRVEFYESFLKERSHTYIYQTGHPVDIYRLISPAVQFAIRSYEASDNPKWKDLATNLKAFSESVRGAQITNQADYDFLLEALEDFPPSSGDDIYVLTDRFEKKIKHLLSKRTLFQRENQR